MSLRRRRSGLRSNKKRLMNTVQDDSSRKLGSIPEVMEEHQQNLKSARDLSSSEKMPKVHAKLLNDTILEERESLDANQQRDKLDGDYHMRDDSDASQEEAIESQRVIRDRYLKEEREQRRGIMSKLSKKMARDFAENKKHSLSSAVSHQSSTNT